MRTREAWIAVLLAGTVGCKTRLPDATGNLALPTSDLAMPVLTTQDSSIPDFVMPDLAVPDMRIPPPCRGKRTFAPKVDYGTGRGAFSVAVGDLNGDGMADLAVANQGYGADPGTVSVLLNQGAGTFAAKVDYATGKGPQRWRWETS